MACVAVVNGERLGNRWQKTSEKKGENILYKKPCETSTECGPSFLLNDELGIWGSGMVGFQCHAFINENRDFSINEFKKLGYQWWLIYEQSRQDLDLCGCSFSRYSEKCFTHIYRALYGDAMLVPTNMGTNMATVKKQTHLSLSFAVELFSRPQMKFMGTAQSMLQRS